MTKSRYLDKFNRFLDENNCKEQFYNNVNNNKKTNFNFQAVQHAGVYLLYISDSFSWGATPEGRNFWNDIANKWDAEFDDEGEEI